MSDIASNDEPDLRHHGDAEVLPGLLDLAVNVRRSGPPEWLAEQLTAAIAGLGAYPDPTQATRAVALRHDRQPNEVLLTSGGAEAFVLLARALSPTRAVCVHPSFTEPEAALLAAGHAVERVVLAEPFVLDPALIPADADLVVIGNPTNPTSVLHPADVLAGICRPGRIVVIDEAFADTIPGESESLAQRTDLPGLVVVRSLTKTWGLAGLRIGYVLADPSLIAALREQQPLWSVSSLALVAAEACSSEEALAHAERESLVIATARQALIDELAGITGITLIGPARSSFVLIRLDQADQVRAALIEHGVVVRRGDTFPGLGRDWLRIAVPDDDGRATLLKALHVVLATNDQKDR